MTILFPLEDREFSIHHTVSPNRTKEWFTPLHNGQPCSFSRPDQESAIRALQAYKYALTHKRTDFIAERYSSIVKGAEARINAAKAR